MFKCFEILTSWFKYLKLKQLMLPNTFDYPLFMDGIFLCLSSDQVIIVEIVLIFLTGNFGFLPRKLKL